MNRGASLRPMLTVRRSSPIATVPPVSMNVLCSSVGSTGVSEYFLPASLAGMAGYWAAGLWVPAMTRYSLMSLPADLGATLLGRVLDRRLDGRRFLLSVHAGRVVIGVVLLIQSVWLSGR